MSIFSTSEAKCEEQCGNVVRKRLDRNQFPTLLFILSFTLAAFSGCEHRQSGISKKISDIPFSSPRIIERFPTVGDIEWSSFNRGYNLAGNFDQEKIEAWLPKSQKSSWGFYAEARKESLEFGDENCKFILSPSGEFNITVFTYMR